MKPCVNVDEGKESASGKHPSNENAKRISISSPQGEKSSLTFTEIYNRIGRNISIADANAMVNSITICDPAVGSGHFLVSCLNKLIAIKSEVGILCDTEGKRLRNLKVEVQNDELIVTWVDDELFVYHVAYT